MHNSFLFKVNVFQNSRSSIDWIDFSKYSVNSFQDTADYLHIEWTVQKAIGVIVQRFKSLQLFIALYLLCSKFLWFANAEADVVHRNLSEKRTGHHPEEEQNASGFVNYEAYMLEVEKVIALIIEEIGL